MSGVGVVRDSLDTEAFGIGKACCYVQKKRIVLNSKMNLVDDQGGKI